MADFGGYDVARRLARTGFTVVRLVRAQTGDTSLRIIKSYEPSEYVQDEKLVAARAHDFLDSAQTQQEMACQDPVHWVVIHRIVDDADPLYVVSDYYEHSLQFLIDGRAQLKAHTLHHLIEGIVLGLVSLKQVKGRGHGNLQASNVLISLVGDLSHAWVALCDPLPETNVHERHQQTDLRDLGELIHQVVVHRHTSVIPGWQASAGPEWKHLGKQGEAWRDLCNRLLLVDIHPGSITLESVIADLARLRVKPPLTPRRALLRAFLVTLGLGLAVLSWHPIRNTLWPPVWDQQAWEHWFPAYCQWVVPLVEQSPAQIARWRQQDPTAAQSLRDRVKQCNQPIGIFGTSVLMDPLTWFAQPDEAWRHPPESFRTHFKLTGATVAHAIQDANQALTSLEDLLFRPDANDYWPWLQTVRTDMNDLGRHRLIALQGYLAGLVDRVQPDASLVDNLDILFELQPLYTAAEIDYERLHPSAADDAALQATPTSMSDFLEQRGLLSAYYRIDASLIAGWRDPVLKRLERARQNLQTALDKYRDAEAAQGLRDLESLAAHLLEIQTLPPVEGQRAAIEDAYRAAQKSIERIDIDPLEWWDATVAMEGISESAALNAFWRKYRNHWLGIRYQKSDLGAGQDLELYWELRRTLKEVRANLTALDRSLDQELSCPTVEYPWTQPIADYYRKTKREDLLAAMLRDLYNDRPIPVSDRYPASWQRYLAWPQQGAALVRELVIVEQQLAGWYGWDEPGETSRTLRDFHQGWSKHLLLKELVEEAGLAVVQERVKRLQQLADVSSLSDPNALQSLAENPPPYAEAIWLLWRRLGEHDPPSWPNEPGQWLLDTALQTRIEAALAQTQIDSARQTYLRRQYEDACFKRHQTMLGKVAGADETLQRLSLSDVPSPAALLPVAREMAGRIVGNPEWPMRYNTVAFHAMDKELGVKPLPDRCQYWLAHLSDWKIIPDPRANRDIPRRIADLETLIQEGHTEARDDPEIREQLQQDEASLRPLKGKLIALNNAETIPAVQRYRPELTRWEKHFEDLLQLEEAVKNHIRPPYCRYLQSVRNGRLAFKETLASFRDFDPVYFVAGGFSVDLPAQFNRFRALEEFPNVRDTIFTVTDPSGPNGERNMGWPTFIQSKKDPSVILRFVPALVPGQEPFYLSLGEVTNRQYGLFLQENSKTDRNWTQWVWVTRDAAHPYPSTVCRREAAPNVPMAYPVQKPTPLQDILASGKANHPVVWVTPSGAQAYATWLNAQLPQKSWHERAIAQTPYRQDQERKIHERDIDWQNALKEYNRYCQPSAAEADRIMYAVDKLHPVPLGAVQEEAYRIGEPFTPEELRLPPPNQFEDVWPSESYRWRDTFNAPPICYDLIGNVWEWVLEKDDTPVLWGGSCLSPRIRENTVLSEEFKQQNAACDVGFRIALRCPDNL
jgi:formylglycine-generating enzyme required for sulfatase activity